MKEVHLSTLIFLLFLTSVLGGPVIRTFALRFAGIGKAHYGNSVLLCLSASALNFFIWSLSGPDAFMVGFSDLFWNSLITLTLAHIIIGKYVWACRWQQSIKANALWIMAYSALLSFTLNSSASI